MELMRGHYEWANRPADQRFQDVNAMLGYLQRRKSLSSTLPILPRHMTVRAHPDEGITVRDPFGESYRLENESYRQLVTLAGASHGHLSKLSPALVQADLNYMLGNSTEEAPMQVLYRRNDPLLLTDGSASPTAPPRVLRAMTSMGYSRVWDADYIGSLVRVTEGRGWSLPLGYARGEWGAEMVPSGAYASDRDCFLFMVDYSRPIDVPGERPQFRGFFAWNSETGSKSWGFEAFLFDRVCGNNIVWGASLLASVKLRHVGDIMGRARHALANNLTRYLDSGTGDERRMIQDAASKQIASNDKEAVQYLTDKGFTKKVSVASVDAAVREEGGAGTVWKLVQGITAHARTIPYRDERVKLERDAARLLN